MIYSSPLSLLNSSNTIDHLDQQSHQWSIASSLLLLVVLLVLFTQNMHKMAAIANKKNNIQNVVNLNYRVVPPEPKPSPVSPPELADPVAVAVLPSLVPIPEPVLQEVQKIIPDPPPVVKEKLKKKKEVVAPKAIKPVRKKKKTALKPLAKSVSVPEPKPVPVPTPVETRYSEPVKAVVDVKEEPASYEQAQVDTIPAAISDEKPGYPYRARRMNVTGYVEIRFLVNKNGRVEKLEIIHAKPEGTFDENVRETVMDWRFNPGIKNNRSVATWLTTTINFELE